MFKKKPKFIEEKHSLEDLYIAHLGLNEKSTKSKEIIICRSRKDSMGHNTYTDILTKNRYRLFGDLYANHGEQIVFNPQSLMSILKASDYKNTLLNQGYITKTQLIEIYNALNSDNGYIISKKDEEKQIVAESCTILTQKTFSNEPAINRENEIEKLMISLALNKKIALIVGNKGIGTTSLVEELAYLIKNKKAPEFLLEKSIIEVNIPSLKRKETKRNTFQDRINEVIKSAKENNAILFIDEADDIVTPKEENEDNINALAMLRYAAERQNLKIIITTNKKNYKEYENSLEFKKQFDVIELRSLSEEELKEIMTKTFIDQSQNNNIKIDAIQEQLPQIENILLSITQNDTIMTTTDENPGFVTSIINKSFAIAKVKRQEELSLDNINQAIQEHPQINKKNKDKALEYFKKTKEIPKQLKK